jgi:Na+(H+)/acetate symporter ActP
MSLSRYALIHLPLPLSILVLLQISQTVCLALVSALVCTFPAVALNLFKKRSTQNFISASPWPREQWHN